MELNQTEKIFYSRLVLKIPSLIDDIDIIFILVSVTVTWISA